MRLDKTNFLGVLTRIFTGAKILADGYPMHSTFPNIRIMYNINFLLKTSNYQNIQERTTISFSLLLKCKIALERKITKKDFLFRS